MKQIETFIRRWPLAVFLMLAGGLAGWILWMFLPQQYTASVRLSVNIDYNRTGKLDDLEQDKILGITEDILHSDTVMEKVFQSTSNPDFQTFFKNTSTTRTDKTWSMTVRGRDPEETARIALLWLDTAYDELYESLEHASKAEALQNDLEGLTRCIQDSILPGIVCPSDTEDIRTRINELTPLIREEQTRSRGISPAVRIGPKNPDQLELKPASRTAAADTFFGAISGLLLAFASVWFPQKEDRE